MATKTFKSIDVTTDRGRLIPKGTVRSITLDKKGCCILDNSEEVWQEISAPVVFEPVVSEPDIVEEEEVSDGPDLTNEVEVEDKAPDSII
jgi:hypothetical protein